LKGLASSNSNSNTEFYERGDIMKKFEGFLTVTDLDGTLIDSRQNISEENIKAIKAYVEEGGLFAVATGRTEENVKPFIKDLTINCPCILYNGAIIYDISKNEYIKCRFLDRIRIFDSIKKMLEEYKNLCVQIFTPGKMYIVSDSPIDPSVTREKQPYEKAGLLEVAEHEWIKILLYDETEALIRIQQMLKTNLEENTIETVFSASTYLELLPFGVSKGSALLDLIEIMQVERKNVIAIGDYCNDIEMIQVAGLGVATKNAHPSLKEAANMTTVSNDENAVHHLLQTVLPNSFCV
jgi:Cof subfamily protein (haloacid dehalogenase superfamily)